MTFDMRLFEVNNGLNEKIYVIKNAIAPLASQDKLHCMTSQIDLT